MAVTSAQVRMARAALDWTVRDLADATGLHRNTINNIEVGRYAGDPKTLELIEKALREAGVLVHAEKGGGPRGGGRRVHRRERWRTRGAPQEGKARDTQKMRTSARAFREG